MSLKIYTKTGDDGTTALFDGTRVGKDNERVNVYGDIDELNGYLGFALSFIKDKTHREVLFQIQKDLFALGAKLANPKDKQQKDKADFDEAKVVFLENEIDRMESHLKPMTNFILPGGTHTSSILHIARTVCRRAERLMVALNHHQPLDPLYIKYVNRLSDYLFVAARFANHQEGCDDIPW